MKWNRVQDKLPEPNTDVVMAWAGDFLMQGKYFNGDSMLTGFAVLKGNHYVGKIGVTHWAYVKDILPQPEDDHD